MPVGTGESESLPLEVRAIGVFLALEVAAGVWFALNWPPGMSVFLSQIPAFGAVGVLWGFMPKEPKDAFGTWLAARLRARRVWMSAAGVFAALLSASCFVNTVAVKGSPDNPTWIHRHHGLATRTMAGGLSPADSARLRRGGGPAYFWTLTSPVGRRVWLRSSTRLTPDERRVMPWFPTTLEYPDDFEAPVVLAVLPGSGVFAEITGSTPYRLLVLSSESGDTLAADTVRSPGAVLVSFLEVGAPADASTRWRADAGRLPGGLDEDILRFWVDSAHVRHARRPLRTQERVRVVLFNQAGTPDSQEVTLHDGTTVVLVPR